MINGTETYPWQPAGLSPGLSKHQPEATPVLCQAGDKGKPRRFLILTGGSSCQLLPSPTYWLRNSPYSLWERLCHSPAALCPRTRPLVERPPELPSPPFSALWFRTFFPAGHGLFLEVQNGSLAWQKPREAVSGSLRGLDEQFYVS